MKLYILLASLVIAISAATNEEELWMKFKQNHSKTYKSLREEKLRFEIFKLNLKVIEDHNARYTKEEETWTMAVNQFADMTDEEFEATYLSKMPNEGRQSNATFVLPPDATIPDTVDWRQKGAVMSVKDQARCGSCWAFSAVGAIEGQNAIKHNIKVDLSEQELVDCSNQYLNQGCFGGWMDQAFAYVKDHGLSTLADYPYEGKQEDCKSQSNSGKIHLNSFVDLPTDEERIKEAVATVGPIAVSIHGDSLRFYENGVFNYAKCGSSLDHGVLVVGYGTEDGIDYWLVKNSWGLDWGEEGYVRMARNKNNQCGIASKASYPVLA